MLKNSLKKMKIFQVKYNQNRYCYYKAEEKELLNENTILYSGYVECSESKESIEKSESDRIRKSLIKYFNQVK